MENKKNIVLPLIIISNLMPLYGVINYGWTIFSVVYIYWIELLIISFFQLLKILFAQGEGSTSSQKVFLGIKFILFRTGIFFFYLLFIVVFLGLLASSKTTDKNDSLQMFEVFFFKGPFYRITLLSFFFYNIIDFLISYVLNNKYRNTKPGDHFIILDIHILVVHIVVVLGTFLYQGVTEKLDWNHKNAMIACVSLFVLVKIIADVIYKSYIEDVSEEQMGKYI